MKEISLKFGSFLFIIFLSIPHCILSRGFWVKCVHPSTCSVGNQFLHLPWPGMDPQHALTRWSKVNNPGPLPYGMQAVSQYYQNIYHILQTQGREMGSLSIWYIDGLVQEGRNSIALAMELRLSSTSPSIYHILQTQGREMVPVSIRLHEDVIFICR